MNVIKTATVMHVGWEMDNEAFIKEADNGELQLVTTSHGNLCEMPLGELEAKIKETEESLGELKALRDLMKQVAITNTESEALQP